MDDQFKQILDLFSQPAFLVKEETVIWRNSAAAPLLAQGASLPALLEDEGALYSMWNRSGTLNLGLILDGTLYDATLRLVDEYELFVATKPASPFPGEANAIVNASAALRKPLHSLVNAADALFDQLSDANSEAAKQLNQSLYRLVRLSGQLSDGGQLLLHRAEAHKAPLELNRLVGELVAQAAPLVESVGIALEFEPSPTLIHTDADASLLERAFYNLLSNALAYTPRGGSIRIALKKVRQTAYLSVSDNGEGIAPEVVSSLFDRFSQRQAGDSRWGMGLGLPMVREIARLHGGSLMIGSNPTGTGTEAVLTLAIERSVQSLRSRMVHFDYCGNLHHGLVELSDVLDPKMYDPSEVQ